MVRTVPLFRWVSGVRTVAVVRAFSIIGAVARAFGSGVPLRGVTAASVLMAFAVGRRLALRFSVTGLGLCLAVCLCLTIGLGLVIVLRLGADPGLGTFLDGLFTFRDSGLDVDHLLFTSLGLLLDFGLHGIFWRRTELFLSLELHLLVHLNRFGCSGRRVVVVEALGKAQGGNGESDD